MSTITTFPLRYPSDDISNPLTAAQNALAGNTAVTVVSSYGPMMTRGWSFDCLRELHGISKIRYECDDSISEIQWNRPRKMLSCHSVELKGFKDLKYGKKSAFNWFLSRNTKLTHIDLSPLCHLTVIGKNFLYGSMMMVPLDDGIVI